MPVIVVLTAAAMIADWVAVARDADRVEEYAKPLVMVGLVAAVVAESDLSAPVVLVVGALLCGLAGDLLLLPRFDRFVPGLGAFLIGHLLYSVAYIADGVSGPLLVVGAAVATAMSAGIGRRIVAGAAWQSESLGLAVVVYVIAISIMWATGIGGGHPLAAAGTTLFVASDAVLGWNRFVNPISHARPLTHVPYHAGQALIAAWAIGL